MINSASQAYKLRLYNVYSEWEIDIYRILFNKSTPLPRVGAQTFEITRETSFCRILDRDTALEPPRCVFLSYKHHNDVRTSGTWYAHTRHMQKAKIFDFCEILLKNPFSYVCA